MELSKAKMEELMSQTLKLAEKAHRLGNSPFGAVIATADGEIIVKAVNTTVSGNDPIAHAEINALQELSRKTGQRKFSNYILISNVQSCPMCFSAAYRSGIRHFIYGCAEDSTLVPKISVTELNDFCDPPAKIVTGVLENRCLRQLAAARSK
jgi:tRNA(Arg) A34 adenosine deaminase TadA